MCHFAPELREIVDVFVDIYDMRKAHPNEAVSIRRALRRSAASTVFASLGSHHPIVLRSLRAVEDSEHDTALDELNKRLDVGGFAWAPIAEATCRAARAALVADRISLDDHEALTAPWREALVERPHDLRPTLAPEFAGEHIAVEVVQRIVDTFFEQRCAARQVPGEAKLILAALRRFPRISSEHPAYVRSVKAVHSRHVFYGATIIEHFMPTAYEVQSKATSIRGPGLILDEIDRSDVLGCVRRSLADLSGVWTAAARATRQAAQAALVADLVSAEDLETLSSAWRAVLSESVGHEDRVALLALPEHDDWLALRR